MRPLLTAALLLAALPVHATDLTGTVLAHDTGRQTLTLTDKTVWDLRNATLPTEGLTPGMQVTIGYLSEGEDGIEKVVSVAPALAGGTAAGRTGG